MSNDSTLFRAGTRGWLILLLSAAGVGFVEASPAPVSVQTSQPDEAVKPLDRLADRQNVVLSRLTRLEDRLFQLSQVLSKSEPEHAARLLDALGASRNMLVRQRIEKILAELQAARLSDAVDHQQQIQGDLQRLLKLLLNETAETKDRRNEMEELKATRKQLERLLQEQEKELANARKAEDMEKRIALLEAAKQKLADLIRGQADLSAATKNVPAAGDSKSKLAPRQKELRGETESLQRKLDADGRSSKDGGPAKSGDQGGSPKSPKSLNDAKRAMKEAEQKLEKDATKEAVEHQDRAEKALRDSLQKLADEQQKLRDQLDYLQQADAQRKTAEDTQKLAKRMEEGGQKADGESPPDQQPGQKGKKPDGSQDGSGQKAPGGGQNEQKDKQSQPSPGSERVNEAVPHQQEAAKALQNRKSKQAAKSQKEALDRLQQARKDIEETLEQIRREQQEELLAALETRFAAMLARQIEVNRKTNRLDSAGKAKWSRSDQLELVETAASQKWVGDESDKAFKILKEDGTTIATPQIVEQIRDDSRDAGKRLESSDTGPVVRQIQEGIVAALEEMLAAVKQMQKENEQQQNNQPGGSEDSNPPLLPGSAELKLLRACQTRINRLTEQIEKQRLLPNASTADLHSLLERIAKRQSQVSEMAHDMVEGESSRR